MALKRFRLLFFSQLTKPKLIFTSWMAIYTVNVLF